MKALSIPKNYKMTDQAELTNRLIADDPDFDNPEWQEFGTIDDVPIIIYYRTTPEDEEMVNENGGDWGSVDWDERIDRITLDLANCDRAGISTEKLKEVCKKYNVAWE